MSILSRLFSGPSEREALLPLYNSIVAEARQPAWYLAGGVADSVDGRFDMVAALLSMTLVRLEHEGSAATDESVLLTEIFIQDMDGQLRQAGIGDIVVGKHIGKMMSALGGRLTAYRAAYDSEEPWEEAMLRNLYRGSAPDPAALTFTANRMRGLAAQLDAARVEMLIQDGFPKA